MARTHRACKIGERFGVRLRVHSHSSPNCRIPGMVSWKHKRRLVVPFIPPLPIVIDPQNTTRPDITMRSSSTTLLCFLATMGPSLANPVPAPDLAIPFPLGSFPDNSMDRMKRQNGDSCSCDWLATVCESCASRHVTMLTALVQHGQAKTCHIRVGAGYAVSDPG